MAECLIPIGQKTAVKFVFLDTFITSKEYQPLSYVEEEHASGYIFSAPVLMTDEMANFISTNCRCFYCKASIPSSLARCKCGGQSSVRIIVEFLKEQYLGLFNEVLQGLHHRIAATRKLTNRKEKLVNAGQFTKGQIAQLLVVQEGLCFYCAGTLFRSGKNRFHVDHYVSLLNGGSNEISNLVLACPACNLQKGGEDPNAFIKRKSAEIEISQKEKTKTIRKNVKAYKKQIRL